jgi:ABC-type multidrug transport system fused ATPase/permease subunit
MIFKPKPNVKTVTMSKITSDVLPEGNQTLSDQVLTFDMIGRDGVKILLLICAGVLVLTGMICIFTFMKQLESVISGENPDNVFSVLFLMMVVIIVWAAVLLMVVIIVWVAVLLRKVRRIIIDSDIVTIKGLCWSKRLKYTSITKVRREIGSHYTKLFPSDFLLLLGWNDKELGRIPMKISDFNVLENELTQRVQNASEEREKIRENTLIKKRSKRRQEQFWSPFLFFAAILFGCVFIVMGYWDFYIRGQMQKYGMTTLATIKHLDLNSEKLPQHELAHGWVEYVFTVDNTEYTRRVGLYESEWIKLQEKEPIEIRYLPDNPNINHPKRGEWFHRHHWSSKLMEIFLGACIFLFGTFCFVLTLFGYTFDTHNGTTYLLKPNQILEDRLEELEKITAN